MTLLMTLEGEASSLFGNAAELTVDNQGLRFFYYLIGANIEVLALSKKKRHTVMIVHSQRVLMGKAHILSLTFSICLPR